MVFGLNSYVSCIRQFLSPLFEVLSWYNLPTQLAIDLAEAHSFEEYLMHYRHLRHAATLQT